MNTGNVKLTLTLAECDAALCIWEWMLENRENVPALKKQWEDYGTCEMRDTAVSLAPAAEAAWCALSEDQQDAQGPFDWEFIPAWCRKHVVERLS